MLQRGRTTDALSPQRKGPAEKRNLPVEKESRLIRRAFCYAQRYLPEDCPSCRLCHALCFAPKIPVRGLSRLAVSPHPLLRPKIPAQGLSKPLSLPRFSRRRDPSRGFTPKRAAGTAQTILTVSRSAGVALWLFRFSKHLIFEKIILNR